MPSGIAGTRRPRASAKRIGLFSHREFDAGRPADWSLTRSKEFLRTANPRADLHRMTSERLSGKARTAV
ncbi:hypothetical protein GCM10010392_37260 [Streptomyces clavifer]|nr:hypothetical protein GCM10010392_37260 [Streptomyces clavifer]